MATKRADKGTSTQANLKDHQEILNNLFAELDDATWAGYEEQAAQENLKLKTPPSSDHIDEYIWFLVGLMARALTRF